MAVFAQQANDRTMHVFTTERRAEIFVRSELAKARAAGKNEPIWVIWEVNEGDA